MSTPNPLVPQGSIQQQSASRNRTRLLVFGVIAVHVVALGGLLFQGCSKPTDPGATAPGSTDLTGTPVPGANDPGLLATNTTPDAGLASTSSVPSIPANSASVPAAPGTAPYVPYVPNPTAPGAVSPGGVPPTPTVATATPVPLTPETIPVAPMSEGGEHKIVKGDTLATVAKKHGVSLRALEAANPGVDSRKLKIGLMIKIPAGGKSSMAAPAVGVASAAPASSETGAYKVKKGDSLTGIAKKHGTTVKELRRINNLKTDQIKVDQTLKVPVKAAAPAPAPEPTPAPAPVIPAYTPPVTPPPAGTVPPAPPLGRP